MREQRDLASRELALAQQEIEQLQTVLARRRQQDADMRVKQAQREAALAHPVLKPLAESNEKLAQQDKQLAEQTQKTSRDLADIRQQADRLKAEYKRIQEMVDAVGLTESIGLLLRKKRSSLPDLATISERMVVEADSIRELELKRFELQDELTTLQDPEAALAQVLDNLKGNANDLPREILEAQAEILLKQKRELLTSLESSYNTAFKDQVALDADRRKLIQQVEEFRNYIDERVLWIRTSGPISFETLSQIPPAIDWMIRPGFWQEAGQLLLVDMRQSLPLYLLAATGLLPLLLLRRRMTQEVRLLGEQAALPSCRTYTPTARTLTWTSLLAIGWPALLGFTAWRLEESATLSTTSAEIARGLLVSAIFLLTLEFLRMTTLKSGLAVNHFGWSEAVVRRMHRGLTIIALCGTPLVFIVTLLSVHQQSAGENEKFLDGLGRPLFIVLLLMISGVSWMSLFQQPAGTHLLTGEPVASPLMQRVQTAGKYLAFAIPLLLAVLVAMGYFYTAGQLSLRLHWTFWLIVGLIILHAIVMRWITVERRKLALEQVKQMRQAAEESVRQVPGNLATNLQSLLFSSFKVDLATIVNQVRSLLQTSLTLIGLCGVWFIWADIVPALGILDRLELWETTVAASPASSPSAVATATGGAAKEAGEATPAKTSSSDRFRKVTARDVALAIVIFAIALLAGQNIPGLMEVVLLRRLSSDRGLHLTVITLVRYLIFTLGVIFAFGQIGVSWSNVQWLVAAASLGLGFGLQEIFANFVSGIIILLERPIREGDIVTVGDVSGTVSKIRFRATTITDWDRKELLVPNKEFITSRVLNWTLSDKVNRLTIKVGVAYGSDPYKVQEVLMKCVTSLPQVLQNPAPSVIFDEFGGSALNFTIRLFLPDLDNRMTVTHQLHIAIYRDLAAAGIEISFPQMDLHVRSIPEDWKIAAAKVAGEVEAHENSPGTARPQPTFDLPDAEG
jgi:potassium efflux system protein